MRSSRFVDRRLFEGEADVGVAVDLGGLGHPGAVQDAQVRGVDRALDPLQAVARDVRHAPERVPLVLAGERELRKGRDLALSEPHPGQASCLVDREVDDRNPGRELLGPDQLGRRFEHASAGVDLPAVVDAAHAITLDAPEGERGATVGAQFAQEADPAVLGPEGDVVLAQQTDQHRPVAVDQLRGQRERQPVVLAHEPPHRRVIFDTGQQVVFLSGDHGSSLSHSQPSALQGHPRRRAEGGVVMSVIVAVRTRLADRAWAPS